MNIYDYKELAFTVLAVIALPLIAIGFLVVTRNYYRRKLAPIAEAFGGEFYNDLFFGGYYVAFMNHKHPAKVMLIPAQKSTPAYLKLEQKGTLNSNLKISKGNFATRVLENIGLAVEINAKAAAGDPALKEAIVHLKSHGFSPITYRSNILTATKARYSKYDLEPGAVQRHFAMMRKLVAND